MTARAGARKPENAPAGRPRVVGLEFPGTSGVRHSEAAARAGEDAVHVRITNTPVSWGVDYADTPGNPPWRRVMDEIAEAGFVWTEPGPVGYCPEDPAILKAELERRGQRTAGGFIFENVWDRGHAEALFAVTHRACRLLSGLGGRYLVIVPHVVPERIPLAGRSEASPRLDGQGWKTFTTLVSETAKIARDGYGLFATVHPHVGTYLEFPDEIDRMVQDIDPELAGLCLDTGHLAYAGADPAAIYRRYAKVTPHLHFKDIDRDMYARVIRDEIDFHTAVIEGVFCPLGRGLVDFAAFGEALADAGYDGFATIEQDRNPAGEHNPLADAKENLAYLRQIGIAADDETPAA